jgi:hypothetical protein
MSEAARALIALQACLGLAILWLLIFYCWPGYFLDRVRQELFGLRDELFDAAAKGAVSFGSPAYRTLRDLMNGMIRFAHKMTSVHISLLVLYRLVVSPLPRVRAVDRWKAELESVSESERRIFLAFHDRMFRIVCRHLIWKSPLLAVICLTDRVMTSLRSLARPSRGAEFEFYSRLHAGILEAQALDDQERRLNSRQSSSDELAATAYR